MKFYTALIIAATLFISGIVIQSITPGGPMTSWSNATTYDYISTALMILGISFIPLYGIILKIISKIKGE